MSKELSPSAVAEMLRSSQPPRLLDVRQPDEHAFAALPGATLIPLGQLPQRIGEIEDWKDQEIVVYCHHGMRSQHAIGFLESAGFQNLHNLSGGIDAWSTEVDSTVPRY